MTVPPLPREDQSDHLTHGTWGTKLHSSRRGYKLVRDSSGSDLQAGTSHQLGGRSEHVGINCLVFARLFSGFGSVGRDAPHGRGGAG